jgi:hypothetical protein
VGRERFLDGRGWRGVFGMLLGMSGESFLERCGFFSSYDRVGFLMEVISLTFVSLFFFFIAAFFWSMSRRLTTC